MPRKFDEKMFDIKHLHETAEKLKKEVVGVQMMKLVMA